MKINFYKKGFTLIELMVVIAIIGLISSIVLTSLATARDRAKTVRAQAELKQITDAIILAQGAKGGKPLNTFAPADCGQCNCVDLTSAACLTGWKNVLAAIETATGGLVSGLSKFERDPWGNPYFVDSNQGVGGASACANVDGLGVYNHTIPNLRAIPLAPNCP